MAAGTPLVRGIDEPVDAATLSRLEDTFEDVRRALRTDGLTLEEFELFGPVQLALCSSGLEARTSISSSRLMADRSPTQLYPIDAWLSGR